MDYNRSCEDENKKKNLAGEAHGGFSCGERTCRPEVCV